LQNSTTTSLLENELPSGNLKCDNFERNDIRSRPTPSVVGKYGGRDVAYRDLGENAPITPLARQLRWYSSRFRLLAAARRARRREIAVELDLSAPWTAARRHGWRRPF